MDAGRSKGVAKPAATGTSTGQEARQRSPCAMPTQRPTGLTPAAASRASPARAELPVLITSSTSSTRRPASRCSTRGSSQMRRSSVAVEEETGTEGASVPYQRLRE